MSEIRFINTTLVEHKLNQFKDLPRGWFCGDGQQIVDSVREYVRSIDKGILLKTDVYAKINGGIGYEIKGKTQDLELLFNPDNTFDFIKTDKESNCVDEGDELPWNQAVNVIRDFLREEPTLSGLSQSASLSHMILDSTRAVSMPHPMGQEFQSLTRIAPLRKADQFVGTSKYTIQA